MKGRLIILALVVIGCGTSFGAGRLRLMSYNIRMGCGHDDPFRLGRGCVGHLPQCAEIIRRFDPDVVGLQEVDRNSERAGCMDQTRVVADLCSLHGEWVEKIPNYGISMLSRARPLSVRKVLMPGYGHTRALMICEFPTYFVANTHFPRSDETCSIAARITCVNLHELSLLKPVFLLGDFNSTPDSEALEILRKEFDVLSDPKVPTWPAREPDRTIDFIMVDRNHADAVKVLERKTCADPEATDHVALVVDVELDANNK